MITAITVTYNTPDLIKSAVDSIKHHYPDLKILIVDGSEYKSPCYYSCEKLKYKYNNIRVHHLLYNIGHGRGLVYGMQHSRGKYVLLFDSDIKLLKPCLEDMRKHIMLNALGCGMVITVDNDGFFRPHGIPYLHPYFALIDRRKYNLCEPAINHGSPLLNTIKSAADRRVRLIDYDLSGKVWHMGRGTRIINPKWLEEL